MAIQRFRTKPSSPLTLEQKGAFILLLFLGLGGVIFGIQSFGSNLTRPIQQQMAELYQEDTFFTQSERDTQAIEESKTKDSDGDGLSDYDEIYIYKTSPYLADSDSDGFTDKEEIFSGNDPNCPTGKTCGIMVSTTETTGNSDAVDAFIAGVAGEDAVLAGSIELKTEADIAAFFQNATMEQVREALIGAGMDPAELEQIDDETLRAFFNGVLDEASLNNLQEEGAQ